MSDDSDVDRENKADSSTTTTITDVVADEELEYGSTYAMGWPLQLLNRVEETMEQCRYS